MTNERANNIRETIEKIRKNGGGVKEETFWEFRRKITGKLNERPHVMKNSSGEIVEDKEKILELFQDFYTNLFTRKPCDQAITESVKLISFF